MSRIILSLSAVIFVSIVIIIIVYVYNEESRNKLETQKSFSSLISFDEWLKTQTERKSRIWSTCRKYNIPVTKKYKTPPRHFKKDSKSVSYCPNLKVTIPQVK